MRFKELDVVEGIKKGHKHLEDGFLGNTQHNTDACCYTTAEGKDFNMYFTSFRDSEFMHKYPSLRPTDIGDCELSVVERKSDNARFYFTYGLIFKGVELGERIIREISDGSVEFLSGNEYNQLYNLSDNKDIIESLDEMDGKMGSSDESMKSLFDQAESLFNS